MLGSGQLNVRRGYLIFVASLAFLPLMDAIAKLLSTRLPVLEIVWARHVVYAFAVVPLALLRDGWRGLGTRHPWWQLARGGCMCLASGCFFMAVSRMPVADAMAIFLCYPAILLPITALALGERPTPRQWSMVACGFIGAAPVGPESPAAGPFPLFQNRSGRQPRPMRATWLTLKIISHLKAASMKP